MGGYLGYGNSRRGYSKLTRSVPRDSQDDRSYQCWRLAGSYLAVQSLWYRAAPDWSSPHSVERRCRSCHNRRRKRDQARNRSCADIRPHAVGHNRTGINNCERSRRTQRRPSHKHCHKSILPGDYVGHEPSWRCESDRLRDSGKSAGCSSDAC